jgi:hypothetical protein
MSRQYHAEQTKELRQTVIPTPRSAALFPGWGVRL